MSTLEKNSNDLFLKTMGKNLEKVRNAKGFSQDRLTEECGLSKGAISKIESGKVSVKVITLAKIADTLKVSIHKIVPGFSDR